jgi:hypothetical protein
VEVGGPWKNAGSVPVLGVLGAAVLTNADYAVQDGILLPSPLIPPTPVPSGVPLHKSVVCK